MSAESVYRERQGKVRDYLTREHLDCAVIQDTEGRRNSSLFYLSGMPLDALLFVLKADKSILVPWDVILANRLADVTGILPYNDFDRQSVKAIQSVLEMEGLASGTIELPSALPHPLFRQLTAALPGASLICREEGIDDELLLLRSLKDETEQEIYREASEITNTLLDDLETGLMERTILTETEIALFIEKRARGMGCEGTGFETIAAGPGRSFGIHAYPAYTGASISVPGFTIVDFGVKLKGYTTDVTLTVAAGPLSDNQKKMCSAVEDAYTLASGLLSPGKAVTDIAEAVDGLFEERGFFMPHSLGHGIGLDAHETPILKSGVTRDNILKEGMIVTLEPGLYDEHGGGVRLENDFLITREGAEPLTTSRILYVPLKGRTQSTLLP